MVADYGYEDEAAWLLIDGGSKLAIDGDYSCEPAGIAATATGALALFGLIPLPFLDNQ